MVTGKSTESLVGSLLNLFNTSSVIAKPSSNYTGSFFFGPNQTISFRNNLPKGRVRIGEDEMVPDSKSFGTGWKRDKVQPLHIDFFTVHGFTDTEGKKEVELLSRYGRLIEDGLRNNTGSYAGYTIEDISTVVQPSRAPDLGNNVWVLSKQVLFRERG